MGEVTADPPEQARARAAEVQTALAFSQTEQTIAILESTLVSRDQCFWRRTNEEGSMRSAHAYRDSATPRAGHSA